MPRGKIWTKRSHYRILGLTGEPTEEQIKSAYETRMSKLRSSDYGDDPMYAKRKMDEVTMAYKVLTGSSPPISKGQKKIAFEHFKDYIENREGNDTKEELHDYGLFSCRKTDRKKVTPGEGNEICCRQGQKANLHFRRP